MIEEFSGTIELTKASSDEFLRVVKKLDEDFMNALFAGERGFTLRCSDGRSVELVPKGKVTEPVRSGYWKAYYHGEGNPWTYRCSACGLSGDVEMPFCPWCGARMDG